MTDFVWTLRHKWKNFTTGVKNFWKWRKAIYWDRDWDHWYIYEILKTKLRFQAEYMLNHGVTEKSTEVAKQLLGCAEMIDKIQNEYYIDEAIQSLGNKQWSDEMWDEGIKKHEEVKSRLYKTIQDNIETWWD